MDMDIQIYMDIYFTYLLTFRVGVLKREKEFLITVCLDLEMATHSSIPAWKIPWKKEPGRLQSIGSQRVRHD